LGSTCFSFYGLLGVRGFPNRYAHLDANHYQNKHLFPDLNIYKNHYQNFYVQPDN